jgi:hypothetical protein
MGRGRKTVLPVVELTEGSPGLSVASRPLCPLPLRQTYQHHSAPGPASISSAASRPAAA